MDPVEPGPGDQPSPSAVRELAERLIDTLNRGDIDAARAYVHEQMEFNSVLGGVEGKTYEGHDGMYRYVADLGDTFERITWRVLEVEQATNDVFLVTLEFNAHGRASGMEVRFTTPNLWTMRDGLVARHDSYRDRDEALRAAGIQS